MGVCAAIGAILATWAALCASIGSCPTVAEALPAAFCGRLGVILGHPAASLGS